MSLLFLILVRERWRHSVFKNKTTSLLWKLLLPPPENCSAKWRIWTWRYRQLFFVMTVTCACRESRFLLKGRPCTRLSGPWCSLYRGTLGPRTGVTEHSWRAGGQTGTRSVWCCCHRLGAPGSRQNALLFGNQCYSCMGGGGRRRW